MRKSVPLAIILLLFAVSTGVLGYLYTTKGDATADVTPSLAIGSMTDKWAASAHSDGMAEAFRHWDEDGEIPARCATCHSSYGLKDYLGLDGTEAGVTDNPAKLGSVVDCSTCHNEAFAQAAMVKFPSGHELTAESDFASCWTCHQGTEGGINGSLASKIGSLGPDEKSEDLGFVNPHYLNVAGIFLGSEANAGYQYEGKAYLGRFEHAQSVQTCTECHDPHSLHLADPGFAKCQTCHADVTNWPDQQKIRRIEQDIDGDGDAKEPTYDEINGLLERELNAILSYSTNVAGMPIGMSDNYPYWYADANANGEQDAEEKQYADWTPRLMRAAFNYRLVKTSMAYIHNPGYAAQLLIDSIDDLAAADPEIKTDGLQRPE